MKVNYWEFNLPFTHAFTIAHGTKTHQPTLIVELALGPYAGYGEAPAISYYNITVAKMIADLEQRKGMVEKFALTDPERYWHYLHHLYPNNPFLVCALDMAAWDLWGKMKNKPLHLLWNTPFVHPTPQTDFTIGMDTIERMVEKMQEKPWPIYKIKMGAKKDVAMVAELRKHSTAVFRVDANAGWTLNEALEKIPALADLGVEFIEQPLHKCDWEGMKVLYEKSTLPLIADESCVFEQDVEKCAAHFHGINIKLTKCSGITPARRMIKKARELNLKVMMGCMNESSIGAAAIAHFAPQLDYIDADGPLLLTRDLAAGISFQNATLLPSANPGLGITPTFTTA